MDPNTEQQPTDAEPTIAPEAEAPATTAEPAAAEAADASKTNDVDATLAAMLGKDPEPAAADAPAEPAATATPEPAKQDAPAAEAKPAVQDADAAKLDAEVKSLGLKGASETRFREMSARIRELETAHPAAARLAEWEESIQSTGATPDQFGATMNYLRMVNSGNPDDIEAAFQQIEAEYLTLAKTLGRPVGGYDPLDDHPDLKEQVLSMDLTRELAVELAQARIAASRTQQAQQIHAQQSQAQREQAEGRAALEALDLELKADPAYSAKLKLLAPALQDMTQTTHPSQWAARARHMFTHLQIPTATTQPAALPPLRPSVPGGSHVAAATDPVDGVLAAMRAAGAR